MQKIGNFDRLIDKEELNKIFLYLFSNLNIDPDLNKAIDNIIDKKDNVANQPTDNSTNSSNETLEELVELCISTCAPYLYHPILIRHGFLTRATLDNRSDYDFPLASDIGIFPIYNTANNRRLEKHLDVPFFQSNTMDENTIFCTDSYLKSEYTSYLKEHIVLSFYYSLLLAFNKDLIENVEGEKKDINIDLIAKSFFTSVKFVENNPLTKDGKIKDEEYSDQLMDYNFRVAKYKHYVLDVVKGKKEGKEYINLPYYLSDNQELTNFIDFSLLISLASKTPNNPYYKKSYSKKFPYSYKDFHKFINGLDDIVLREKELPTTSKYRIIKRGTDKKYLSDETEILYNNYLLERLFHFDFISFLVKKYTALLNEKNELGDIYKNLFIELSSLAFLPNIFSRDYMTRKFLNSYSAATKDVNDIVKLNKILENWTIDIKYFQTYLLKCVFPILNTTFLYIMSYVFDKKGNNIKELCELFENYIKTNKEKEASRWNIYEKYPRNNADEEIAKYIRGESSKANYCSTYSINSYNNGKLIADKYDLFQLINKHIFYEIMSGITHIADIIPYDDSAVHPGVYARQINSMTNIFQKDGY